MLWFTGDNLIYILYSDGSLAAFDNTWTTGESESDPAIAPPEGRYQPVRAFGKVWRGVGSSDWAKVRERLGWALAPEQTFTSTYQRDWPACSNDCSALLYIRQLDGAVVVISMYVGHGSQPFWRTLSLP